MSLFNPAAFNQSQFLPCQYFTQNHTSFLMFVSILLCYIIIVTELAGVHCKSLADSRVTSQKDGADPPLHVLVE